MRIHWIDIAKGIAILLVCVGHTRLGETGVIASWIASFHMPLFFVMAGLCFDENRYHSLGEYVVRKCRTLAYPYFMLTIFVALFLMVFSFGAAGNCLDSMLLRVFPGQNVSGFWFIRILFFVEIAYALFVHMPQAVRHLMVCILGVIGFYLPPVHDLLRVNTICISLFFYEFGCLCRPLVRRDVRLIPALGLVLGSLSLQMGILFMSRFPVEGYGVASFHQNGFLVIGVALLGCFGISLTAQILDRIPRVGTLFAWFGQNSLALLALHPNAGICRSYWVQRWPVLKGWPSMVLEFVLILIFLVLLSTLLKFFVKMPRFRRGIHSTDIH